MDDVFEAFDKKFTFVMDYAQQHNCVVLQAGDLSDSSRNWDILDYYMEKIKCPFYCVFGQHDLYNRADHRHTPTTLLSLIKAKKVYLLGRHPSMIRDVAIYGASWGESIPEPGVSAKNLLVLHAPISKRAEWDGHDFTSPRYFMKKHFGFDVTLVGDIHKAFKVKLNSQTIVNTGPMLRLEANEYNFVHKPHFYVWCSNTWTMKKVEIPHQPAEEILTREHIEVKKLSQQELDVFATELKTMKPLADMRKDQIKHYLAKEVKDKRVQRIIMGIIDG